MIKSEKRDITKTEEHWITVFVCDMCGKEEPAGGEPHFAHKPLCWGEVIIQSRRLHLCPEHSLAVIRFIEGGERNGLKVISTKRKVGK